jgi:RecB family endonuclease NucS
MAINQKIWQMSDRATPVKEVRLESEELLEALIEKGVDILNENWLIIGRQVITSFNKYIDLLAIDGNGSLIVVELKKDRTPRDVVAQLSAVGLKPAR